MRSNPQNERLKRQYLTYLKEARQLADRTLDGVARALTLFETYSKGKGFQEFHIQQAIGFKNSLVIVGSARTGSRRSVSSRHTILRVLKSFFQWLAGQPGYKSRIKLA